MEINENINLKRLLDILKRKKFLIIFTLIIFIVLGYLYSYKYITPKYQSTSSLLLIPNNTSETITNSDLTVNSGLISTYSSIATNSKVLKQVISNLHLDLTEDELLSKINVNVKKNTYIIEITVNDQNPKLAMNITKELSNVFLKEIQEIYNLNNIGIIDEAQVPSKPYNIHHKKDLIIFFGLGLIASFLLIILIYIFNNKIEKEEEIEKYLQIKSLGIIPFNPNKKTQDEIIDKSDAKSYVSECINTIRTNILYMNSTNNAKTVLITSSTPNEGKSWISANIAVSFAEINKKVLLIDADMRKGRAHKIFNVENKHGLSEFLYSMTGDVKEDLQLGKRFIQETQIPSLHILTNGGFPQNPSELLASSYMKELIALFKTAYDIIIVDAPPCKLVTDSIILSTIVDSTVLVVNSANTSINEVKEVKKSIGLVDGEIIGAILNKVKISGKTYKRNYYYSSSDKMETYTTPPTTHKVSELIDEALIKLAENNYILYPEDDKALDLEETLDTSDPKHWIKRQNEYLEKLMGYIADMKVQLNYTVSQNQRDTKMKLENIHNKLIELHENSQHDNLAHTANLNKIVNDLENVKTKHKEISGELESIHTSVDINSKEMISKQTKSLENIQANINSKTQQILDNNIKISESLQNNFNYKNQELLNANSKISKDIEYNLNTKLEDLLNTNAKTLEDMKDNLNNSISNNENIEKSVNTKYNEILEASRKALENIQANVDNKIKELMQNNKESFEALKSSIINNSHEALSANNSSLEKMHNTINNDIEQAIANNNKSLLNSVQQDRQMMLALDQKIMRVQQETQNLLKNQFANINYTDKLNEINSMIFDLKNNYLQLYNIIRNSNMAVNQTYSIIKNSNMATNQNNRYYNNVIPIQPQNNNFEKTYSIANEVIPYYELEQFALEIIPLKNGKPLNVSQSYK